MYALVSVIFAKAFKQCNARKHELSRLRVETAEASARDAPIPLFTVMIKL